MIVDLDELWEALKLQCCATKPTDKNWTDIKAIIQVKRDDLKQALKRVREAHANSSED